MARSSKNNAWNEVFALVLLGVGTLLFLALISYNPEGPAGVGSVELSLAAEPAGAKFHRPVRRDLRRHFVISSSARRPICSRPSCSALAAAKLFHARSAGHAAHSLDRSLHRLRRVPAAIANAASARLASRFQYPGTGRLGRLLSRQEHCCLRAMGKVGSIILLGGIYVDAASF